MSKAAPEHSDTRLGPSKVPAEERDSRGISVFEIEIDPISNLNLDVDTETWVFAESIQSPQQNENIGHSISSHNDAKCKTESQAPSIDPAGCSVAEATLMTTCVLSEAAEGHYDDSLELAVKALNDQCASDGSDQLALVPPEAALEDGIDLDQLIRILKQHKDHSTQCPGQDVVVILGNTGAGKSLTVNYLCGRKIVLRRISSPNDEIEYLDVDDPLEGCVVCHSGDSQTKYLGSYMDTPSGLVFCDTPGFEDTEGSTVDVANSIAIAWTIRNCSSVRLILLIEAHLIANQKGKEFKGLIKVIQRFIDAADFASVLPLFTHCEGTSPKKIQQHLERFMSASHFSDARPFLVHIANTLKEHGDHLMLRPKGSQGKKNLPHIKKLIFSMPPNVDTRKYVKSPLGEDSTTSLKLACKNLSCKIERSFRLGNPTAIYKHDLDSLKLLSNALGIDEITSQYLNICGVLTEQAALCCDQIKEAFHNSKYIQAGKVLSQLTELETLGEHLCEGHAVQSHCLHDYLNESVRGYLTDVESSCGDFRRVRERLDDLQEIQVYLGNELDAQFRDCYDRAIQTVTSMLEICSSSALALIDERAFATGSLNALLGQLIQTPIFDGHVPNSMHYQKCADRMRTIARSSYQSIFRNLDSPLDAGTSAEIAVNLKIMHQIEELDLVHIQELGIHSRECQKRLEEVCEEHFVVLERSLAQRRYQDVAHCLEQLKMLGFRQDPVFVKRCSGKLEDIRMRLEVEMDSIDQMMSQNPSSEEYAQFLSSFQFFDSAFKFVDSYLKSDEHVRFDGACSRWMRHIVQIHEDLQQQCYDELGLASGKQGNPCALARTLTLVDDVLGMTLHFNADTEVLFARFVSLFVRTLCAKGRRCAKMAKIAEAGISDQSLEAVSFELANFKQFLESLQHLQTMGRNLVSLFRTVNCSDHPPVETQDAGSISQYIRDDDADLCDDTVGPALQRPITSLESLVFDLEQCLQLSVRNLEDHANILAEHAKISLDHNGFTELKGLLTKMSGFACLDSLLNVALMDRFESAVAASEHKFQTLKQSFVNALQGNKLETAYEILHTIHKMVQLENFIGSSKEVFKMLCVDFQGKTKEFGAILQKLFECRKLRKLSVYITFCNEMKESLPITYYEFQHIILQLSEFFQNEFECASQILQTISPTKNISEEQKICVCKIAQNFADTQSCYEGFGEVSPFYTWLEDLVQLLKKCCNDIALQAKACVGKLDIEGFGAATNTLGSFRTVPYVAEDICKQMDHLNAIMSNRIDCLRGQVANAISKLEWRIIDKAFGGLKAALHLRVIVGKDLNQTYEDLQTLLEYELKSLIAKIEHSMNTNQIKDAHNDLKRFQSLLNSATVRETEYNKDVLMRLEGELHEIKQEMFLPRILAGDQTKVKECLAGFREVDRRNYQRQCMTILDKLKNKMEECRLRLGGGNRRNFKVLEDLLQEVMLYEQILCGDVCIVEVKTYKEQLLRLLLDNIDQFGEEIQAGLVHNRWLEVEGLSRHMDDAKHILQNCDIAGKEPCSLSLEKIAVTTKTIELRAKEIASKIDLITSFDIFKSSTISAEGLGVLIDDVDSQFEFFQVKYGKALGAEGISTETLVGQIKAKVRNCKQAACAFWNEKQYSTMKEMILRLQALCNVSSLKLEANEVLAEVQQDIRQKLECIAQDCMNAFQRGIETQHTDKSRSIKCFQEANSLLEEIHDLQGFFGCFKHICHEDLKHKILNVMIEYTDKEADTAKQMFSCESGPQAQDVLQAVLNIWAIPSEISDISLKQYARAKIADIFKLCKDWSHPTVVHRINFVELASMLCAADVKGSEIVEDFKTHFESFLAAKFREATARMTPEHSVEKLVQLNGLDHEQRSALTECMSEFTSRFRFLRQTCSNVEAVVATIRDGTVLMLKNKMDVPCILAAIFAVWSILLSSENEDTWPSPHPVQVLALFRILGVDASHLTPSSNGSAFIRCLPSPIKSAVSWLCRLQEPENSDGKGHLVEIKTGEGKSLVLGALATFLAMMGFHVDCVCYSKYLSKRDYEKFQGVFAAFGVQNGISYNTFASLLRKLTDSHCDVRSATKQFLLRDISVQECIKYDSKRILLIDEVDVFFSKEFYGSIYAASTVVMNENIEIIQRHVWQHRALPSMGILNGVKCLEAYSALTLQFAQNRTVIEQHLNEMIKDVKSFDNPDHLYKIDEEGKVAYDTQDTTSNNLIVGYKTLFAHFKEHQLGAITEENLKAAMGLRIRCGNFSYAELPLHYEKIFGVTGTLQSLGDFERKIVHSEYKIKAKTVTPSIFGDNKLRFRESSDLTVENDIQLYNRKIKEGVLQALQEGRAVLVFFQDEARMNAWLKSGYAEGVNNISVVTTNTKNIDHYLKQATRCGTVTLFTAVHGRGLDFVCHDRTIDRNGGMHVIQTFLSGEYSEEVQIKGRTARNGKNGTFELVLYVGDLAQFAVTPEEIEEASKGSKLYEMLNSRRRTWFRQQGVIRQQMVRQAKNCHIQSTMLQDLFVRHAQLVDSKSGDAESVVKEIRDLILRLNHFSTQKCRLMCLSDATGSMSDLWISAKQHIETMLERIEELAGKEKVELRWVAYRDYDAADKVIESCDWTHKPIEIRRFLDGVTCHGGGDDGGEAVEVALRLVNDEETPPTRVLLIGDEPPHGEMAGSRVRGSGHELKTDWRRECAQLAANGVPVHTFRVGNRETTAKAFEAIAQATGGKAQDLESPDALLDVVCLNCIEEIGGPQLVQAYRSRYMKFSFAS